MPTITGVCTDPTCRGHLYHDGANHGSVTDFGCVLIWTYQGGPAHLVRLDGIDCLEIAPGEWASFQCGPSSQVDIRPTDEDL